MNTIHSKVILKNNKESMFESTKQLTQHIETSTGTEPINRKKVSQSKRSLYELYLKTLCLHLTKSFIMLIIMFDLFFLDDKL